MISSASRLSRGEPRLRDRELPTSPIQTTVLIPAYNEEQALPHVLKAILAVVDASYEVLVVDDGSQDKTAEVAESFSCRVISHDANRGKGAAMKTGFAHARGDKIIVIDGDATYPADTIPEIARQLDHHDIVRCVRSGGRENIPLVNRLGNRLFDTLISTIHSVEGADMLSGLYGLHRRHLAAMRLGSDGFEIESEIMIKARSLQLKGHTIPIEYNERIGEKKLHPLRDGIKILFRILSLALKYNPFAVYVLPGLGLGILGFCVLGTLSYGPIITPYVGLGTHTFIVSAMAFLAGFQLVICGFVVNLYAVESGLGRQSKALSQTALRFPRFLGALIGLALIVAGTAWSCSLALAWLHQGLGPFRNTESLVIALSLIIWGIQVVSAMLLLSLFAGSVKYQVPSQLKLRLEGE